MLIHYYSIFWFMFGSLFIIELFSFLKKYITSCIHSSFIQNSSTDLNAPPIHPFFYPTALGNH